MRISIITYGPIEGTETAEMRDDSLVMSAIITYGPIEGTETEITGWYANVKYSHHYLRPD